METDEQQIGRKNDPILSKVVERPILRLQGEEVLPPSFARAGHQGKCRHEFPSAHPLLRRSTRPKEAVMLFVALGSVRAGTQRERIARRLEWSYPPGMKVIAEYHLMTPSPAVISIAEADDI